MIRKFVELKSLKVTDSGPGTISGYRATYAVDEGADLIVPGAFADTIEEYLSSGFTAESHDWNFSNVVGFPLEAKEDQHGFYVVSQFHSTPDAQNVRIKARERMDAGKKVGFSFGYVADNFGFIEAKDYEQELPKYVKSADLSYNLAQAKKFPRIRLLKKLSVAEDSLVTRGMNTQAFATAVKSRTNSDDIYRLRIASERARIRALEILYCESSRGTQPSADALRMASLRLRSKAMIALYG